MYHTLSNRQTIFYAFKVFHNNIFFPDDIGDLGITDHTHNTRSDFLFEFLEVIVIAPWRYLNFTPEIEGRRS